MLEQTRLGIGHLAAHTYMRVLDCDFPESMLFYLARREELLAMRPQPL